MADIARLAAISGTGPVVPAAPTRLGEPDKDKGFGAVLGEALAGVNRLQQESQQASRALAEGRADMLDTVVAVQKADVAFQLVVQIRNKLVEAYQEVMRMQV